MPNFRDLVCCSFDSSPGTKGVHCECNLELDLQLFMGLAVIQRDYDALTIEADEERFSRINFTCRL